MLLKIYTMAEAIDLAIDDCYEPVSKKLRSKRPKEETETPEEEIETPEEETETPEEAEAEKRFVSPKSLHTYQAGFVPKNTSVNTKWAVKNFIDWQTCYNSCHPKEPCPDDVLLSDNPVELSLWLQRYILGTRKKVILQKHYLLLCGLYRYMKEKKERVLNIFNREDPDFKKLFKTCDSYFRELRDDGVGSESSTTEALTKEDEEKLWVSKVLDPSNPKGLLNAVFFLNGKNFALRGGTEHRSLKLSQIKKNISPEGKIQYTYTENCSKNRAGGFNQLNVPNKVVHQYQDLGAGERCHVYILDTYLAKLPPNAEDMDIFYLHPNQNSAAKVWYASVPIGKNILSKMLKTMCSEAGIEGNKSNHSLRAYAATELFQAGISEKVIQDRTGHRSLDGLRKYEHISEKQKEEACKALRVVPQSVKEHNTAVTSSSQVFNMECSPRSVVPSFSFGAATLSGCTINVYQGAYKPAGDSD